ncbi:sugar phosphate isomerase/epimerase, partial [Streptomyces albogriseolus]
QIEDMRRGVHEHLPFGDGEIDFPPVLAALAARSGATATSLLIAALAPAGRLVARRRAMRKVSIT